MSIRGAPRNPEIAKQFQGWEMMKGKENSMGRTRAGNQRFPAMHERFTSGHFRERVVSLHGESGGLKIRRERVGTVTTHLAPWSKG